MTLNTTSRSPHHVLFVIDSLYGWGGAEGILLRMTRRLSALGYRCSVVTFNTRPSMDLNDFPCPVHLLPAKFRFGFGPLAAIWRIRQLILSEGVDVVHTFFEASDIMGGLAGALANCPVIISSRRDMGILRTPAHDFAYRLVDRFYDQIQTVSERVREFVIERDKVDPLRVVTVHNGVNLQSAESAPVETGPDEFGEGPRIISIGHLRPVKGYDVLLRAAALVVPEFPSARFLIAGAVSDHEHATALQRDVERLGLESNIRFLGLRHDIPALMSRSDLYCLLSRSEGLSNALLESMAAGLPSVVTSVGGNPEVVADRESGFLVDPENHEQAAEAILRLLRNPELQTDMGRKARKVVEERFTVDQMVATVLSNYRTLLDRPGRKTFLERLAY